MTSFRDTIWVSTFVWSVFLILFWYHDTLPDLCVFFFCAKYQRPIIAVFWPKFTICWVSRNQKSVFVKPLKVSTYFLTFWWYFFFCDLVSQPEKSCFLAKIHHKLGFKGNTLIFILFLCDGIQCNLGKTLRYSRVQGGMKT